MFALVTAPVAVVVVAAADSSLEEPPLAVVVVVVAAEMDYWVDAKRPIEVATGSEWEPL